MSGIASIATVVPINKTLIYYGTGAVGAAITVAGARGMCGYMGQKRLICLEIAVISSGDYRYSVEYLCSEWQPLPGNTPEGEE